METNTTAVLAADSQETQKMVGQVMKEMLNSLPKPKLPAWFDSWVDFIKIHPLISLGLVLLVILIISAIIREIICSYLKTSEILARLKRIEEKIK